MKKFNTILPALLLLLLATARLHAQITGCDDSPENPTLILGCIAGAASVGYVQVRRYWSSRKNTGRK